MTAVIRQGDEIALELESGAFLPISGVETIITQDVIDSIEESDDDVEEEDGNDEGSNDDSDGNEGDGENEG